MNIKTFASIVGVILLAGCCSQALAAPRAGSNYGRDYVVGSSDLGRWSAGAHYNARERNVTVGPMGLAQMKTYRITTYAGYDLQPWFTAYVSAGQSRTQFNEFGYGDGELDYGGGFFLNLLDHEIPDPALLENRIRISAGSEYNITSAESPCCGDVDWSEFIAFATIAIVNDIAGNKSILPNSIAFYGGPIYSRVSSDDIREASDDRLGFMAGMETFLTKRVSFDVRVENFEHASFSGGVNICF